MDVISAVIGLVIGVAVGAWGYRYAMKRDPAALEALAQEIRRRSP